MQLMARYHAEQVVEENISFKTVVSKYGLLFGANNLRLVCRDVLLDPKTETRGSIINFYNEVRSMNSVLVAWLLSSAVSASGLYADGQELCAGILTCKPLFVDVLRTGRPQSAFIVGLDPPQLSDPPVSHLESVARKVRSFVALCCRARFDDIDTWPRPGPRHQQHLCVSHTIVSAESLSIMS